MATLYYKYRSTKNKAYLTARFQFRIFQDDKPKDIYFDALLNDERFFVEKEYFEKVYKIPAQREIEKNSKNLDRRKRASDLDAEENKLRHLSIEEFNKISAGDRHGKFKVINDIFYENSRNSISLSRFKIYVSKLLSDLELKKNIEEEINELSVASRTIA